MNKVLMNFIVSSIWNIVAIILLSMCMFCIHGQVTFYNKMCRITLTVAFILPKGENNRSERCRPFKDH